MDTLAVQTRSLSVALADYAHTRALFDGRVRIPNLALNRVDLPINKIIDDFLQSAPWEAAEMSMGKFVALISRNECDFIGLPVFPHRAFRHGAFYVRADSDLLPAQLRNKRIGIPDATVTAVIYARALLTHFYGIQSDEIEWIVAGVDAAVEKVLSRASAKSPPMHFYENTSLTTLLLNGDIDAMISPHAPKNNNGAIRPLFADYSKLDYAYWQTSGLFPIMHAIVLRRDVERDHPGTRQALMQGFSAAKEHCIASLLDPAETPIPLPFLAQHVERVTRDFGEDFWPYGLDANRKTLDAFLDFCFEQGVSCRRVEAVELFPE